jgi:hypothetical protein
MVRTRIDPSAAGQQQEKAGALTQASALFFQVIEK